MRSGAGPLGAETIRLGLVLNSQSAADDIELARRAERAGFASVYAVEFFNRNALVRLAAIAQATSSITVGTGIANTFTRSPMVLAAGALDLDEIADGRLVLGLGTGLKRMNEEWYDVRFSKPASKANELFELLRTIFETKGPGFSWRGDFWKLEIPAYHRPRTRRERIPLWLAAVGRGMIKTAGSVADGLVGHPVHSRRWHSEVTLPLVREAETAAGREPGSCPLFPYVITAIDEDRDAAVLDAKRMIGFSFTTEHYHTILDFHGLSHVGVECRKALSRFDTDAMAAAIPDELVAEIAIAGTPRDAREQLAAWETIADEVLLYPASIGISPARARGHLDRLFETFGRSEAFESYQSPTTN